MSAPEDAARVGEIKRWVMEMRTGACEEV